MYLHRLVKAGTNNNNLSVLVEEQRKSVLEFSIVWRIYLSRDTT